MKHKKVKQFTFRDKENKNKRKQKESFKVRIKVKMKNKDFYLDLYKGDNVNEVIDRFTA